MLFSMLPPLHFRERVFKHSSVIEKRLRLAEPEPKPLKSITRDLVRPYLGVKRRLAGPNVRLARLHHLGALEDLPEQVEKEKDGDANIGREEIGQLRGSPWMLSENLEAVEEDDEAKVDKGDPGLVRLPPAPEDHGTAIDILGDACFAEMDICVADCAPCEE